MNPPLFLAEMSQREFAMIYGLAGMFMGALFGVLGIYLKHRRQAMWHELAKLALEKGQPLPPQPADSCCWNGGQADGRSQASNRRRGLLIGGLVNIAVGAGLFIAMVNMAKQAAYFAAIPFFIGVALLLAMMLEGLFTSKSKE